MGYAPGMALISPEDLAARLTDPNLRIVDVRWVLGQPGQGRVKYDAGHLPGAIFVDLDEALTGPGPGRHPLPSPAAFAAAMARPGSATGRSWSRTTTSAGGSRRGCGGCSRTSATRGWRSSTAAIRRGSRRACRRRPRWSRSRRRSSIWRLPGTASSIATRCGRVSGRWCCSTHGPGRGIAARSSRSTRSPATSRRPATPRPTATSPKAAGSSRRRSCAARFAALGADGSEDVVTSCGSGVSATHNALAMRVAGLPDPILYVGSFSDWSTAGYPVATGADPGDPPE